MEKTDYVKMVYGVVMQRFEEQNGVFVCAEQYFVKDKDTPAKRIDFIDSPNTSFSIQDGQEVDFPIVLNQPE